ELTAQREREEATRIAERERVLQENLKVLTEFPVADMRASIAKTQSEVRGTSGFAAVQGDLDKLAASLDSIDAIQASAREGRAADILTPALAGFVATETIMSERSAKVEEAMGRFRKLLMRNDSPTAELERQSRDMTVQTSMAQLATGPFGYFVASIATLAKGGSAEIRRATFDAVVAAIQPTSFGRAHLERILRTCYEEEDDAAVRRRFAATMATLQVPLVAPKTESAPAGTTAAP
ncbi:MAG TPA: hypothetical protein VMS98_00795, partial [Thermoanaerobaculia bacterium]|nr:hypothetical protein [Thermoanaerobaculia bacterium]